MTDSEHASKPADASDPLNFDPLRVGTIALYAGAGLAVLVFIAFLGRPPWLWIVAAFGIALIGVGLRIEAAIRARSKR
ncbi:hypothetical protein AB0L65_04430 [Nonomuraea sp. NPDC052116]|uniref:hypothetical protein n=1 Tax=Nonomuraea sp. NPDC052116 TaxID=3155665 RepID=UPI00343C2530